MSESLLVPEAVVSTSTLAVLSEAISIEPAGEGAWILGERLDLPDERYLEVTLANAIYRKFHACQDDGSGALRPQRIAAFEQQLSEQIPVPEFEQPAVYLGGSTTDGMQETHSLISIEGVKVCIENRLVISRRSNPVANSNILVTLPAARPAASPGFFYTLGAAASLAPKPARTVRLYVNVTHAEHAPKAWGSVLAALESLGNRYSAKVLSDPAAYPRNDAIVAYIGDPRLDQIKTLSYALSDVSGVGTQTSVFAERIAPGIAIAEEPNDLRPTMRALSFGQHRSLLYARTLINSAQKGRNLDEELMYQLTAAGVDPARPAMNAAG
ncbi:UNVERIFIED_CONTAM: hypothetical protein ABIE34_002976 [Jeotgalibacillus campisalis]